MSDQPGDEPARGQGDDGPGPGGGDAAETAGVPRGAPLNLAESAAAGSAEADPASGEADPASGEADPASGEADPASGEASGSVPGRNRLGKAFGKAVGRSPRIEALAQRAQQTARDGYATARKAPAVDRTLDASRTARDTMLPRLSHAGADARQRIADNPEVAQKVARSLAIAVVHVAAASQPADTGSAMKKSAPLVGDRVGTAVSKLLAKGLRHPEEAAALAAGGAAVPDGSLPGGGETGSSAAPGAPAPGPGPGARDLGALADSLGVRPPPDPAALYHEGPGRFELMFPLPDELASLPWGSLSRRNHFYLLVAAWARREADGIQLLKAGQFDQASETFQECLIRAEQVQTPELVARSYQNLAEAAAASGDEDAARAWRAAADGRGT